MVLSALRAGLNKERQRSRECNSVALQRLEWCKVKSVYGPGQKCWPELLSVLKCILVSWSPRRFLFASSLKIKKTQKSFFFLS